MCPFYFCVENHAVEQTCLSLLAGLCPRAPWLKVQSCDQP